ncbi:hypothetical protein [Clostridium botulinum]|uniref:hypothetical protein n=1 Tax=Clostridium botulinum TaxID=1491 RepID=UPI0002074FFD|nr:hypothetical protein [Clostridium botulinum]AEB77649.1 hypothetical protein CbC4_7038 [Clostridium botulinum BKT015925]KLU74209.1 hypothetical protein CBC3_p0352 [Clostridium botulinum V891]MCD3211067.1 hypothetical protein [Clostridium botulinum C/D]MCD3259833.1 hypothetical protein [Clostridium botulinum C/D]MCD3264971.1 hypothetical protein [Clostridium botulinum C/D]
MDKEKIEKIVKLYFAGASVKEAIEIVNIDKEINLEDIRVSRGWKYQQLKM